MLCVNMESITVVLLITLSLAVASPPSVTKHYRNDFVYNSKTDAFYKLHHENSSQWQMNWLCLLEGASPMAITSDHDVMQVHDMMKEYPDLGEYAWIANDGPTYQTVEELFKYGDTNAYNNAYNCEVITRDGIVKSTSCDQRLPFVCKVEAKDAPYDERCGVYGRDYEYFPSVNSCYKIPGLVYFWDMAYAQCQAEGALLVVINSETERAAVQKFAKSVTSHLYGDTSPSMSLYAGFRAEKTTGDSPRVFKTIFNQTLKEAGYAEWSEHERNSDCVFYNSRAF